MTTGAGQMMMAPCRGMMASARMTVGAGLDDDAVRRDAAATTTM
ncbi:hypothetical protein [Sorangium sp. So ce1182]